MFDSILPQFGIGVKMVPYDRPEAFEEAINEKTRAVYVESIGNPVLGFTDIKSIAEVAHRHHLPLIVDNTFATPYLLRPIEHGADIVVHSLTKWLGGHGSAIGGIVVDSGTFDWTDSKFSLFNEPDDSYHGVRYAHDLGDLNPLAFILRMRLVPLRNLGAAISPDNAWIFLQGIETLPLRMQRHSDNALAIARFLKGHDAVSWIRYPGLEDDPSYPAAREYLDHGFGGMVVFGVKGGYDAAVKVIDSIDLFSHLANVGDAKSLILHPASTSHSQLNEEQQKASGLTPDLIRLSIGLEHIDDLQGALDEALKNAQS
jgi:O-acetylhomoserine (thiol)-lyase